LLLKLKAISKKELMCKGLDFEEYELICSIEDSLKALATFPPEISGQIESEADDHMAVIVDVHTDPKTRLCLEEAVGCPLNLRAVAGDAGKRRCPWNSELGGELRSLWVQPCKFGLGRNYPNPFNSYTVIPFSLPSPVEIRLAVYDLLGGVYLYRMEARGRRFSETRRMELLR